MAAFWPDLLKEYVIEKISGEDGDGYHRYLLKSKRSHQATGSGFSPFEALALFGSGVVAQEEDKRTIHRRRLIMILNPKTKTSFTLVSLYENAYR